MINRIKFRHELRTTEDALVYVTECNLATVSHMNYLKRKSMHEFDRQINIAQTGIDFCKLIDRALLSGRVLEVIDSYSANVKEWLKATH